MELEDQRDEAKVTNKLLRAPGDLERLNRELEALSIKHKMIAAELDHLRSLAAELGA